MGFHVGKRVSLKSFAQSNIAATLAATGLIVAANRIALAADPPSLDALKICAANVEDIARLACYDRLLASKGVKVGPQPDVPSDAAAQDDPRKQDGKTVDVPTRVGAWDVLEIVDKLDGAKSLFVSTTAAEEWDGGRPDLALRCQKNRTEVFIITRKFVGTYGGIVARWRVDDSPIKTEYWSPSRSGRGAFASQPIPLIKALIGKREFVLNISSRYETGQTLTFQLDKLEQATEALRKLCGW